MGGGGLDYRPTHPEYNYKRGGSQTFDPPTQAGATTRIPPPPRVNLIPYKRSLLPAPSQYLEVVTAYLLGRGIPFGVLLHPCFAMVCCIFIKHIPKEACNKEATNKKPMMLMRWSMVLVGGTADWQTPTQSVVELLQTDMKLLHSLSSKQALSLSNHQWAAAHQLAQPSWASGSPEQ